MNIHAKTTRPAWPLSVAEVVPGRLFAIGGSIPGTPHPCWMAADTPDWIPLQCYVFREGSTAVIVDTGTAAHRAEIRAGLKAVLAGTTHRELIMTRREPECSMNLDWIAREFGVSVVRCGGDLNPLDFFDSMDDANTAALVQAATETSFEFIRTGDVVKIGPITFESVRPPVRVLASTWFYEPSTRTMFTSDFWGFITRPGPLSPTVVHPTGADLSPELIRDFSGAKFDFLWSIDTRPIFDDIRRTMERYPSDRICPTYGCIIEGREAVQTLVARTGEAMEQLAARPWRSDLEGFELRSRA